MGFELPLRIDRPKAEDLTKVFSYHPFVKAYVTLNKGKTEISITGYISNITDKGIIWECGWGAPFSNIRMILILELTVPNSLEVTVYGKDKEARPTSSANPGTAGSVHTQVQSDPQIRPQETDPPLQSNTQGTSPTADSQG